MFARAGASISGLNFWWEQLALDRGLAPDLAGLADTLDLWVEVEAALDALADLDALGGPTSYYALQDQAASTFSVLGGFERVPLWAFTA